MSCFLPLNPSIQRRWRRLHALDRVMMERSRTAGGFEKRTSLFLLFGATNIHPTMVRSYVCGYIFLIYWLVLLLYKKTIAKSSPKVIILASIGLFGGAFQLRLFRIEQEGQKCFGLSNRWLLTWKVLGTALAWSLKRGMPFLLWILGSFRAMCTSVQLDAPKWRILTFKIAFQQAAGLVRLLANYMVSPEVRWCFSFKFKWLGVHDPTKVIFRSLKEPYLGCIQCIPWIRLSKRNASFRANLILERLDKQSLSKYQWVPRVHHLNWKGFLNLVRLFWGGFSLT